MSEPMPTSRDREGFEDTDSWPCWPWLPVKNYKGCKPGGFAKCSVMHVHGCPNKEGKYIVIHVGMSYMTQERLQVAVNNKEFDEYNSISAMMEAGWMGD